MSDVTAFEAFTGFHSVVAGVSLYSHLSEMQPPQVGSFFGGVQAACLTSFPNLAIRLFTHITFDKLVSERYYLSEKGFLSLKELFTFPMIQATIKDLCIAPLVKEILYLRVLTSESYGWMGIARVVGAFITGMQASSAITEKRDPPELQEERSSPQIRHRKGVDAIIGLLWAVVREALFREALLYALPSYLPKHLILQIADGLVFALGEARPFASRVVRLPPGKYPRAVIEFRNLALIGVTGSYDAPTFSKKWCYTVAYAFYYRMMLNRTAKEFGLVGSLSHHYVDLFSRVCYARSDK